jgi:thioredoxin reductase (NADPH)
VVGPHCDASVPGLFAAGDVVWALDQLAVATGHGAIAATAMHSVLCERE